MPGALFVYPSRLVSHSQQAPTRYCYCYYCIMPASDFVPYQRFSLLSQFLFSSLLPSERLLIFSSSPSLLPFLIRLPYCKERHFLLSLPPFLSSFPFLSLVFFSSFLPFSSSFSLSTSSFSSGFLLAFFLYYTLCFYITETDYTFFLPPPYQDIFKDFESLNYRFVLAKSVLLASYGSSFSYSRVTVFPSWLSQWLTCVCYHSICFWHFDRSVSSPSHNFPDIRSRFKKVHV